MVAEVSLLVRCDDGCIMGLTTKKNSAAATMSRVMTALMTSPY